MRLEMPASLEMPRDEVMACGCGKRGRKDASGDSFISSSDFLMKNDVHEKLSFEGFLTLHRQRFSGLPSTVFLPCESIRTREACHVCLVYCSPGPCLIYFAV